MMLIDLTLSGGEAQEVYPILESLQSAGVTIRTVTDWGNPMLISDAVTVQVGSHLLSSSVDLPLSGYNIVLKEKKRNNIIIVAAFLATLSYLGWLEPIKAFIRNILWPK